MCVVPMLTGLRERLETCFKVLRYYECGGGGGQGCNEEEEEGGREGEVRLMEVRHFISIG